MASLNVVRVDFAQAHALRAGAPLGVGWRRFAARCSSSRAPHRHAPSIESLLTRLRARHRARRASAVDRILRKGIAALE
jgi:hypothetical protein